MYSNTRKSKNYLHKKHVKQQNVIDGDWAKYGAFYPHSKAKMIINDSDIDDAFKSICTTVISNI